MHTIPFERVKNTVCGLAIKANTVLRRDVLEALKAARRKEAHSRARHRLDEIIENARIAQREGRAICQDTGMPVVFVEMGQGVVVGGGGIERAIQQGVALGYRSGYLRNSIVRDPLRMHVSKPNYGPAIVHYEQVASEKLKITVLPKGFGCENKSQLRMFLPTADRDAIADYIVSCVQEAGADACPPYVIGVGIGGTADYASMLAKKALLRPFSLSRKGSVGVFEKNILSQINALRIGPMGLQGNTTALAVNVEMYPTHIAGLPVAINISCHALRSASALL